MTNILVLFNVKVPPRENDVVTKMLTNTTLVKHTNTTLSLIHSFSFVQPTHLDTCTKGLTSICLAILQKTSNSVG